MKRKLGQWMISLGLHLVGRERRGNAELLTDEEMAVAFSRSQADTLLPAVRQVIGEHLADCVTITGNATLADSHGKLAYAAGGIAALQTLMDEIKAREVATNEK